MIVERLGRYRIKSLLGQGGMGEVYLAADESLDRDVALKVLPMSLAGDPAARVRLLREARLASRLNHPNICTIHEAGEDQGMAYLAMERIEGQSLSLRLREGALPYLTVVALGRQIAAALAHAHQRGVVHRDLKCGNVMITPAGTAKVLDFGLAKLLSPDEISDATRALEPTTTPGMVVGTLSYLPPEAFRGSASDVRGDVWALGVMLHEMACGQRPFEGATGYELCSAILNQPPKPLPGHLPEAFRSFVARCLSKSPGDRFADGVEALAAFESLAHAPDRRRGPRPAWLLAAALLAGFGFLGLPYLRAALRSGPAPGPVLLSLAVLPLEDLSGKPEEAYLADGLHETLINDLSQFGGLKRVVQRQSVLRFQGSKQSVAEIARELRVDGLLTGSVARSGSRIRVTAALVRAQGEETLWSRRFEREMADLLTLENELVDAIGQQVKGAVQVRASSLPARNRKLDPEATERMLKGRFEINRMTPQGFQVGLKLLQEAAAMDPGDARIQAALALGHAAAAHDAQGQRAGAEAARRAIALDPNQADAHAALAMHLYYVEWDWSGAEASFRKALALNPNHPEAHAHLGWLLLLTGRTEEALREERAATVADPLMANLQGWLAWMLWDAGNYDEALVEVGRTHRLEPDNPWADFVLAQIEADRGHPVQALASAERAGRKLPMLQGGVGILHAKAGRRAEALRVARELEQEQHPMHATFLSNLYASLGDRAAALRWMTAAVDAREPWAPYMFVRLRGWGRNLDPLRDDPRFKALAQRVGLPA